MTSTEFEQHVGRPPSLVERIGLWWGRITKENIVARTAADVGDAIGSTAVGGAVADAVVTAVDAGEDSAYATWEYGRNAAESAYDFVTAVQPYVSPVGWALTTGREKVSNALDKSRQALIAVAVIAAVAAAFWFLGPLWPKVVKASK
jgi:hypothetical protein